MVTLEHYNVRLNANITVKEFHFKTKVNVIIFILTMASEFSPPACERMKCKTCGCHQLHAGMTGLLYAQASDHIFLLLKMAESKQV